MCSARATGERHNGRLRASLLSADPRPAAAGSFPALCDGGGASGEAVLSLLRNMSQILSLDTEARTVTVAGGTTYSQLTRFLLEETELALPTAASLAHTTIAGSVATGS